MSGNKIKIAFLDRDGVINKEINYLYKIEDFEYTYKCKIALKNLIDLGYKLVIITNQAGIAKGYYTIDDYEKLTSWYVSDLLSYGVDFLDILKCPHHPEGNMKLYTKVCDCRKPNSGMLNYILNKYDVDISKSILVGDKVSDIKAGLFVGLSPMNCFLVESGHTINKKDSKVSIYNNLYSLSISEFFKKNIIHE